MFKNFLKTKLGNLSLLVFFAVSIFCAIFLYAMSGITSAEQDALSVLSSGPNPARPERSQLLKEISQRKNGIGIKGIYLTAYSAGSDKKMAEIIDLINRTELNAVVIDIKDYGGEVLYDSNIAAVNEFGLEDNRIGDMKKLVAELHRHNIYVIARQTVFQDPILAEYKPEWALKNKRGGIWRDYKGLAWVNAANKDVWDYNIEIAKEAAAFGFDEINFDYVRFPSDGNMADLVYDDGREKYEVMKDFFQHLNIGLSGGSFLISLDMFGFVMEKEGEDDMNIGQRLADALDEADAVCPMMYPSHYPSGHLGLANPADYPALVLKNGLEMGAPKFVGKRARLRPWIQAFNLGAVYDANKIRAQIDEVEKYTDGGWLLWNAANRYTEAGLKVAELIH